MKAFKKTNQILFFILVFFVLLYFGAPFLVPFIFGVFFAALMTPFSNMLEKVRASRGLSSLGSTLVIFIVVGSILYLLVKQISLFVSDISLLRDEIQVLIQNFQAQIASFLNISLEEQKEIWQSRSADIINRIEIALTTFLGNILNTTAGFLLMLVYTFLLLYYRDKFAHALMQYFDKPKEAEVQEVIKNVSRVVHHYLWGRAKVMAMLGIMYYITFLIFDIPYAGLLTIFGALITIIPYVGPLISGILPILFGIIYLQEIYIILLFILIIITEQLVESYVFEPLIIGREVKINPLIVIIAITLGGMIWGLAGMILFVPLFAVFKIISSHTPGLEPLGYFLGPSKQPAKD